MTTAKNGEFLTELSEAHLFSLSAEYANFEQLSPDFDCEFYENEDLEAILTEGSFISLPRIN
jgi:hypothetical protein